MQMQTAFQVIAFAVGIGAAGLALAARTERGPRSFLADLISSWSIMTAAFIGLLALYVLWGNSLARIWAYWPAVSGQLGFHL
jgi:hypothetical protein